MIDKEVIYKTLEDGMVKYADLIEVPIVPTREKLVPIYSGRYLVAEPINEDMQSYTGDQIYVRETVLGKLGQAAELLAKKGSGLQLEVVYGYRALEIQRKLFFRYKKQFAGSLSGIELLEATHRLVAVPEVAGHPTGGAVDIRILQDKQPLAMGTEALEFVRDSYTFSPFISKKTQANRMLLREVMLGAGFAPFDGEWWHFSYGDKEWAKYYKKPNAFYEQLTFTQTTNEIGGQNGSCKTLNLAK